MATAPVHIRAFQESDWPQVWAILHDVISTGDTYPYPPDSSEQSMYETWITAPAGTFVAVEDAASQPPGAAAEGAAAEGAAAEGAAGGDQGSQIQTPGILGFYMIKPNNVGLASHVCNCGYVVGGRARGRGVAAQLCRDSQARAVSMGFRAMQFNLVVATNERAVRLWQHLGYSVVGRLPGAFNHAKLGYVDALVMFKQLVDRGD